MPTTWSPKRSSFLRDTPTQVESLCREFAEYMPEIRGYEFHDSCGCYSEYTTDPPRLTVEIYLGCPGDLNHSDVQARIRVWAEDNLEWGGCPCCNGRLSLSVYVFVPEKKEVEL